MTFHGDGAGATARAAAPGTSMRRRAPPSAASAASRGLSLEVEGEEAFEDLGVGEVDGPAVGGENGGVVGSVGVREPGWALVVEVGEGPHGERRRVETGRIEPTVAEADELTGGGGDRPALLFSRARERERLERGRRCVSRAGLLLSSRCEGPEFVNSLG
jgi:hypothetical protein